MANQLPIFKNFGKTFKDFNEKKFQFARELRVKSTTAQGVTFETVGSTTSKAGDYSGSLKVTQKNDVVGNLEGEFDTKGTAKGFVEYNKFANTLIKLSGDQTYKFGLDFTYRADSFTASSGITVSPKNTILDFAGSYGYQNVAVGGAVQVDAHTQQPKEYDAGLEVVHQSSTVTVKTAEKGAKVLASIHHVLNSDFSFGGSFLYSVASSQRDNLATFVAAYNFDRETTGKIKFSTDNLLTTVLEQRLSNPKIRLGFTTQFNVKSYGAPENFGLSLGFGDF